MPASNCKIHRKNFKEILKRPSHHGWAEKKCLFCHFYNKSFKKNKHRKENMTS